MKGSFSHFVYGLGKKKIQVELGLCGQIYVSVPPDTINDGHLNWNQVLQGDRNNVSLSSIFLLRDFPGGAVVKNPPANARDTGLSPSPGRSQMP